MGIGRASPRLSATFVLLSLMHAVCIMLQSLETDYGINCSWELFAFITIVDKMKYADSRVLLI